MENELTKTMTMAELIKLGKQYPSNKSVQELVQGILAARKVEEEARQAEADFTVKVMELAKLPKPPDSIHNIHLRWGEVEESDMSQPEVEVEVITTPATYGADGKIITVAIMGKEMRHPMRKVIKWIVETNKGFQVGKTAEAGTPMISKRAITVNKRNGNILAFVGNFPSASKAAEYLKLTLVGDSATRVLTREGYIIDAYTGTDYTK